MRQDGSARETLLRAIDRMAGVRVLVVADLVLDEFEYGEIDRVSREAPVLILTHRRTDRLPGGGANAVNNLASLGGSPLVIGRVGTDEAGEHLVSLLQARGADTSRVWRQADYVTPVKRRILGGGAHSLKQQIVRVDRGGGPTVQRDSPLLASVREGAAAAAGALLSDYSFGILHPGSIAGVVEAIHAAGRPLFADSRGQLALFRGLTAATPNLQEAETLLGERLEDDAGRLAGAGERLRESLQAGTLVITRGSQGMSLFASGAPPVHLPVYGTDEVADVTGAGDTVIAVFTLATLGGSSPLEAARLANYAGGLVVMKRGTATVSQDDLRRAVRTDPALDTAGRRG